MRLMDGLWEGEMEEREIAERRDPWEPFERHGEGEREEEATEAAAEGGGKDP
jgi:hypothetical protein